MTLRVLDASRLSPVSMKGITFHWTGGGRYASALDKEHYHLLFDQTPAVVYAIQIALNSGGLKPGYAAHTLNANSDRIGTSMCGMMGAVESPFNAGAAPLVEAQWNLTVLGHADLCEFYQIGVARDKVLSHCEVQPNLGITQRGKWDIARLPWDPSIKGGRMIGDKMRDEVLAALKGNLPQLTPTPEAFPAAVAGASAIVTANGLNFRRGPGMTQEKISQLPAGTLLTVTGYSGEWLQVKTPLGYSGWVHGAYVKLTTTAPPISPSVPDPLHGEIEAFLDRLEALNADLPDDRETFAAALRRATAELAAF